MRPPSHTSSKRSQKKQNCPENLKGGRRSQTRPDHLVLGHGLGGLGAVHQVMITVAAVAPLLGATLVHLAPLDAVLLPLGPLGPLGLLSLLLLLVLGVVLSLPPRLA